VLSLLNRRSAAQGRSLTAVKTPPLPQAATLTSVSTLPVARPIPHPRATEIARWLDAPCSHVLVSAMTPAIIGAAEPYVPNNPHEARVAQWLALPEIGLLAGDWAGYAACYQPTPLGRAVVYAMLADTVSQRTHAAPTFGVVASPGSVVGGQNMSASQPGRHGGRHAW
jgi:hypothetical protein